MKLQQFLIKIINSEIKSKFHFFSRKITNSYNDAATLALNCHLDCLDVCVRVCVKRNRMLRECATSRVLSTSEFCFVRFYFYN